MRLAALGLVLLAGAAGAADPVYEGAFRDAQMAIGSRTAVALSRSAARRAAGDPVIAGLLRARQDADAVLAEALSAEAGARTKAVDVASAAERVARARQALATADVALVTQAPSYVQLTGVGPVPLAEAQALLRPDEAIVLIVPAADTTYVFVVTKRAHGWYRSGLTSAALAAAVAKLRAGLDPLGLTRAGEDAAPRSGPRETGGFDREVAHKLYRGLLAAAEPMLRGVRTLYAATQGPLSSLPLAVLVTAKPRGRDGDPAALRATDWLIRRYALVTMPSVASMQMLRRAAPTRQRAGFAGFGDPLIAAPSGLPRLPDAAAELTRLATVLGAPPSTVLVGAAATEGAVKRAPLGSAGVVAFATHGLLAGEGGAGVEPGLILTPPAAPSAADDGLLTASEAAMLQLDADWVILSACNTAGPAGRGGEGLSGLARGFFAAGARAVLASHWRVRDDVAGALTGGTLAAYRRDPEAGRAGALRRAMLAMIADRRHPERADPALWAPFVIAGEGR